MIAADAFAHEHSAFEHAIDRSKRLYRSASADGGRDYLLRVRRHDVMNESDSGARLGLGVLYVFTLGIFPAWVTVHFAVGVTLTRPDGTPLSGAHEIDASVTEFSELFAVPWAFGSHNSRTVLRRMWDRIGDDSLGWAMTVVDADEKGSPNAPP